MAHVTNGFGSAIEEAGEQQDPTSGIPRLVVGHTVSAND
jgi:hypothetical protein